MSDGSVVRSRIPRALLAIGLAVALVAIGAAIVKAANGGYSGKYRIAAYFSDTGQGIYPGSDVDYRGIQIGSVSSVALAGYRTIIVMSIDHQIRIPSDTEAVIEPKNVFGTEDVALTFPKGPVGPYLAAGGVLGSTSTSPEIGDLLAAADPLLQQLDAPALGNVISQSAEAVNGEGATIAEGFQSGSSAASLLADTIDAQITALDAFENFSAAIAGTGPLWNRLAADSNQALPVLDRAAPSYQRVLQSLTAFSNDVSSLLHAYRPDIATLLGAGDNVNRVLLANKSNIEDVVSGLYRYVYKLGNGASEEVLPDGSRFGYFKTFVLLSDVNRFVCSMLQSAEEFQAALPSSEDPLAFLATLESALAQGGGPISCGTAPLSPPPVAPAAGGTGASPADAALNGLAQGIYQLIGGPQPPPPSAPIAPGSSGSSASKDGGGDPLSSIFGMLD